MFCLFITQEHPSRNVHLAKYIHNSYKFKFLSSYICHGCWVARSWRIQRLNSQPKEHFSFTLIKLWTAVELWRLCQELFWNNFNLAWNFMFNYMHTSCVCRFTYRMLLVMSIYTLNILSVDVIMPSALFFVSAKHARTNLPKKAFKTVLTHWFHRYAESISNQGDCKDRVRWEQRFTILTKVNALRGISLIFTSIHNI